MSKQLTIVLDKENIEQKILSLKNDYEEERYVRYGEATEWDDKTLTEEEYQQNVDIFLEDFRRSILDLNKIIEDFPKKKNGTFNRKNIVVLAECRNCEYICEWHNTWIYMEVKVVAWDDTTLRVEFYKKVDTPA